MKKYLFICSVLIGSLLPSLALACSSIEGIHVVSWPTADGWSETNIVPAPIDTHILFSFTSFGFQPQPQLTDQDGTVIQTKFEKLNSNWYRLIPNQNLRPNTKYTVTIEGQSARYDSESWTFETGDSAYTKAPPLVEKVTIFEVPKHPGGDTCINVTWDREYLVRIPEPKIAEPFIYEVIVETNNGEESFGLVSHDWGGQRREYTVIPVQTTGMTRHPCMRVKITDIAGRTIESARKCVPYGCFDEKWRQDHAYTVWDDVGEWEKAAQACDGSYLDQQSGCSTTTQNLKTPTVYLLLLFGLLYFRRKHKLRHRSLASFDTTTR